MNLHCRAKQVYLISFFGFAFCHLSPFLFLCFFLARADWEWLWAVFCFNVYIHGFLLADRAVLKASQQGKDHPLRKHRLQDRLIAQYHHRQLVRRQQAGEDNVDMNEPPPMVTRQSNWHYGGTLKYNNGLNDCYSGRGASSIFALLAR
jgi:hypothetical protein